MANHRQESNLIHPKYRSTTPLQVETGIATGIRTLVSRLKICRPGPLDDRDVYGAGNRRKRYVGALPTELRRLTPTVGLEPTTTRLTIEVTVLYTTAFEK